MIEDDDDDDDYADSDSPLSKGVDSVSWLPSAVGRRGETVAGLTQPDSEIIPLVSIFENKTWTEIEYAFLSPAGVLLPYSFLSEASFIYPIPSTF
jgi:hypothetical protein